MILVAFAVPFESVEFRRSPYSRGVKIVHTGIGPKKALAAMRRAIEEFRPQVVVSSGFAGGLADDLEIGEVLEEGAQFLGFRKGVFAASEVVLSTAEAKRAFRRRTRADAVDMESGAIRCACEEAGVRMVTLRAVSDRAEDDLPVDPELLVALAERPLASLPRLGLELLWDAEKRARFFRMAVDARTARRELSSALERLLPRLEA